MSSITVLPINLLGNVLARLVYRLTRAQIRAVVLYGSPASFKKDIVREILRSSFGPTKPHRNTENIFSRTLRIYIAVEAIRLWRTKPQGEVYFVNQVAALAT